MAISEEGANGSGMVMPVTPMYGGGMGNSFGGDWAWIILLLLLGWGNNGWGGNGNGGVGSLYPWMNQTDTINGGFRDQMLNTSITSIRDGITGISSQLCNGFASAEIAANGRQMADMNQMFALQSQFADCCCENRLATADLKYTIATEECATRSNATMNARDIIDSQTRGTQVILDKLCQLELDGKQDRINDLERQLTMANLAASQERQTSDIQSSIINELRSCPIPSQPVYGSQPIFTCSGNNGCGCGCGSF